MSEDFLSRWSRRKDEARRVTARAGTPTPAPPTDETATPEPGLSPDEIAALPKIDALTADTDITGFLRRGVPDALRNAALRKMWLLDPAIRDFAGHARDYDYDWNTPGGAPGYGALGPGDDVGAMLRRVIGEPNEKQQTQDSLTPSDLTRGSSSDASRRDSGVPGRAEVGSRIESEGDMRKELEPKEREPSPKLPGDDHA